MAKLHTPHANFNSQKQGKLGINHRLSLGGVPQGLNFNPDGLNI
jgi:hypothetical protein